MFRELVAKYPSSWSAKVIASYASAAAPDTV